MLSVVYVHVKIILSEDLYSKEGREDISQASHLLHLKHSSQPPWSKKSRSPNIKGHCEEWEVCMRISSYSH